MSSFYYKFLTGLAALNLDDKICANYLAKNLLDKKLVEIINASKEVTQLQSLLADTADTSTEFFERTLKHLEKQQHIITSFYERWFEKKKYMGNLQAHEHPDVIVILGCHKDILEMRVASAIEYATRHPNACIVLSGGGFSSTHTESDAMLELIKKADVRNEIIQEKTSMDTLGNAFFTKLLLKEKNRLAPNLKVLVVTSQFHSPRSLYYFNTIYKSTGPFEIAVQGVKTTDNKLAQLALHELLTEYQAESSMGIFENTQREHVDDTAILVKLFQYHILYKNRYDILRKFLTIASKE